MYTIIFNRETSIGACGDPEYDYMFLRQAEHHINTRFRLRGYIYAEHIYDCLSVEWKPEWDNPCRIYNGVPIKFTITPIKDGFEVHID